MARVATIQHLQDFHVHQVLSPYDSAHAKLSVQTADLCGQLANPQFLRVQAGQCESKFTHIDPQHWESASCPHGFAEIRSQRSQKEEYARCEPYLHAYLVG